LPPAYNSDGLLLKGYAITWDVDRVFDAFSPYSLDKAVETYMASNPVLLYSHQLGLPPVGRIIKADIHREKGLFVEALMPRPEPGTFSAEVWDAAKNGVLKALSGAGKWIRRDRGDHNEIVNCAELVEISLCPVAVNGQAFATSVEPSEVKCLGSGVYVSPAAYSEITAINAQLGRLTELKAAAQRLSLIETNMTVAENFVRARLRR
jgi:HK97 family phage prohead protease